ncbi:type II toxin-antitoxin system VapC family toxin [Gemmata sp.]|uniref:type II toxin-antitoxin system VapC family toxin n=1 Tax=Gemmata sp. TaxID=1914242 RepID=UPI003F6F8A6A
MTGPFLVPPPGGFVLDASVTSRWCLTAQATTYTSRVLGRVVALKPCVPVSWSLHLADTLRVAETQRLVTAAEVDLFLSQLVALPIFLDDETPARAWPEILALARTHLIPVYDAAYLELAVRVRLPLATIDAALARAAAAAGVPLFAP